MLNLKRKLYRLGNDLDSAQLDARRQERGRKVERPTYGAVSQQRVSPSLTALRAFLRSMPATRAYHSDEIIAAVCMLPSVVSLPFGHVRMNPKQQEVFDCPALFSLMPEQVFFYKPPVFTPKWGAYTFDEHGHLLAIVCTDLSNVLEKKRTMLVRPLTLHYMQKELIDSQTPPAK